MPTTHSAHRMARSPPACGTLRRAPRGTAAVVEHRSVTAAYAPVTMRGIDPRAAAPRIR